MGLERMKSEGVMGDDSELVQVSGKKRVTEEVWVARDMRRRIGGGHHSSLYSPSFLLSRHSAEQSAAFEFSSFFFFFSYIGLPVGCKDRRWWCFQLANF